MDIRVITISGEVCSGKSSVAKALLSRLPGWERVNTGQRFREFCAARGMSIQQVAELDDEVHRAFDADQKQLIETGNRLIVEGRLAGWLAREVGGVFRVYCTASFDTRVERCMRRDGAPREQAASDVMHRDQKDVEKYRQVYGLIDYRDPAIYHLCLDTTSASPESLAEQIVLAAGI